MNLPSISIVTPSFNQAPYLESTLRSVLDQEYPQLEYFVMDGGSTDGSREIIVRHHEELSGWVSEQDDGQADAIARGFDRCSGEILAYINSDDTYLPGALRAVGEAFVRHPDAVLIYGDSVYTDPGGLPILIDVLPRYRRGDLLRQCIIPQQAAFWRRDAYQAVGGIDPSFQFALDYDLFLRLSERGPFVHLPRLLATFRQHPEAKTSRALDQWAAEDRKLHQRYLGREGWNAGDWLRMKWLTARQLGCIAGRRLKGERFPVMTPARWHRAAKRKLARIAP